MTVHPDFCHFIKAPERCKGLKTTTKCSLSPPDHYMLYSISVPETKFPGERTAIFGDNFHPSESGPLICGGLFFLKKKPKRSNMSRLNQLELIGPVQPIRMT
jgi:hypothetical protein